MPAPRVLAIRADGGPGIGAGHLSRCLALAQAWVRHGGAAVLVTEHAPPEWRARYEASGCTVAPADGPRPSADWWVADGYGLSADDREGRGARVVLIDDFDTAGTRGAGADVVVDQNLDAEAGDYPEGSQVLVGSRYALIRREVVDARSSRSTAGRPLVLVVLGGAPNSESRSLAKGVAGDLSLAHAEVILAGGADAIESQMAGADVAIAGAGSVCWELCFHGVPAVLLPSNDHQARIANSLVAAGAAIGVEGGAKAGPLAAAAAHLLGDESMRRGMSDRAHALVDGRGAERVASLLWRTSDAGINDPPR